MRLAIVGNGGGRGNGNGEFPLFNLTVSLVSDTVAVVILVYTGNGVSHGYFHGVARIGGGINALRGNKLHIVACDNAGRAHGNFRVVDTAIVGLFGNGSRYGHGLCVNVGRKLNGGFFQVIVVLVRTGEGYGRGIPNGLVRADLLIIEREFEAGLIEVNLRTFYNAVKLSVGAVNLGIGVAVIHLRLCLEACYGNILLIYYKLRSCAADVVRILVLNGSDIFTGVSGFRRIVGNGQFTRVKRLTAAGNYSFAQVDFLRFAVEGHGGIGYAGNLSSLLLRNLYGEINGYFADILCLNGNGSLVCAFLVGFDVLRLYGYIQTAVACKRAGYGFKRKVSVTVNGSGYVRKLARAYILYCTCQAFGQRSANANSLDNLGRVFNFPRIGMRSRYRCVDCRRGVIVVIALNAGEHIIGSRGFKAGNGAGQFSALLPLAFSGGSLSSADYIFLFGNNVQLKAIGSCIRGGRRGRRVLIGLDYFKVAGCNGGSALRISVVGRVGHLHGVLTCVRGLCNLRVAAARKIFDLDAHVVIAVGGVDGRVLCSVISEGGNLVKVNAYGFLLRKHSLYRHVRAAHGEGYVSSLCFCFRQGYTGNFPLDELVVKVAWFGGKGDLVAFAHDAFGDTGNAAAFAGGNGQVARGFGDGNGVALCFCARLMGIGFGIAGRNIIGLAVLHGELGFLAEILTGAITNKKIFRIVVNIFNGYNVLFGFDYGLVGSFLRGFFDLRSRCFHAAHEVFRVANPNSEYLAYVVLGNSICICCTDRLSSAFTIPNVLYLLGIAFNICRGKHYAVNGISGNDDLAGQESLVNDNLAACGLVSAGSGYGGFAQSNGSHSAVLNGSNGLVRAAPNYLIGSVGGFNGCGKRSRFAAGYGQRVPVQRYARAGVDNGEGGGAF